MWIDDELLLHCEEAFTLRCWVPEKTVVVVGSSNNVELEVDVERCQQDGIEILRRYGGGGAVVLHPGCVILSLATWMRQPYENQRYFDAINLTLKNLLNEIAPEKTIALAGISDITCDGRKIVGTSLFRSRGYLLYQASILVDAKSELIARYLRHPSREPKYREKKSHQDFVGNFSDKILAADLCIIVKRDFPELVRSSLKDELVEPNLAHCPHLHARYLKA